VTTVDVHVVRVFVDPSGAFGNPLGTVGGRVAAATSQTFIV
jgi:hypothetical protein